MRDAVDLVPTARLLHDAAARFDDLDLSLDLAFDRSLDRSKRVHVLDLGLGAELARAGGPDRDVGIAAQRAFFHLHVADAKRQQRAPQRLEVGDRFLRAMELGLGDALHERHAGAIEVDQRVRAARDAPVARTGVRRFAGILLEVDAREPALVRRAVLEPVLHDAAKRERHVVLRNLIIFRHVRIEVIFAVELRERRNLRTERKAGRDDVLDRFGVGNGKRARHAETDRTDLGVRLAAELVSATAEHLRRRLELDVTLDSDHGFVGSVHARTLSSAACAAPRGASHARTRAPRRAAAVPQRAARRAAIRSASARSRLRAYSSRTAPRAPVVRRAPSESCSNPSDTCCTDRSSRRTRMPGQLAAGHAIRSHCANARSKSRAISVRAFCART